MKILRYKKLKNHFKKRNATIKWTLSEYTVLGEILCMGCHFVFLHTYPRYYAVRSGPRAGWILQFNPQGGKIVVRNTIKKYLQHRQQLHPCEHTAHSYEDTIMVEHYGTQITIFQIRKESHKLNERLEVTHCSSISTAFITHCSPLYLPVLHQRQHTIVIIT
jgi:hypothetical protein